MGSLKQLKWWQKAVFYQIYPRSFADGNGDGIGDFKGIINKLDYLKELGIDGIWLSPHFPSPQVDCGYDISDYTGVAVEYGTLEDFEQFLNEAHARGIRVVLDLVLNHTSNQHPWFIESRSSLDNPKRDWYIWKKGKDGKEPTNWWSTFGGSAWEYDVKTGEYYYHFFFKEQPDLNWRNPQVKGAMWQAVRFWLDMGVDGFRLDAIGTIFEDERYLDQPAEMTFSDLNFAMNGVDCLDDLANDQELGKVWEIMFQYQAEQPGMHELMQELRNVIDEYDDRILVGENDLIAYQGNGNNELHMVFNFPMMRSSRMTPSWVRANQEVRLGELAKISPTAWACNTLGNHDSPRVFNRYGDGQHDEALARVTLAIMLTLRGTPFLYNGEEIGMVDLTLEDHSQLRDSLATWFYRELMESGCVTSEQAMQKAGALSRDKNRTPMQWANLPLAGFSPPGTLTWLPVNPNYQQGVNVAEQENDPQSLLSYYRRLLRLRRENPALVAGDYKPIHRRSKAVLSFTRESDEQACLVMLNTSPRAKTLSLEPVKGLVKRIFSSAGEQPGEMVREVITLKPFECFIGELPRSGK